MTPGETVPALDRGACWRAHRARDARFDGRFYTAVLSTGIYCRPICPARTPRPEHCAYYPSAAAAQAAGFRPCLRCRPELAPGVAGWRGTANTVARALALIAGGAWGEDDDVDALAERVGVGERQLRRLFARHVGAPPVRVAQAQRVLLAKRLVAETRLPLSEVAAAAGFGSLRRFNEVMRRTFHRPPSALRRSGQVSASDGAITIALAHTAPYDWDSLLAFLAARAIPGVEQVVDGAYRRTVALARAVGTVEVRPVHAAAGCRRRCASRASPRSRPRSSACAACSTSTRTRPRSTRISPRIRCSPARCARGPACASPARGIPSSWRCARSSGNRSASPPRGRSRAASPPASGRR